MAVRACRCRYCLMTTCLCRRCLSIYSKTTDVGLDVMSTLACAMSTSSSLSFIVIVAQCSWPLVSHLSFLSLASAAAVREACVPAFRSWQIVHIIPDHLTFQVTWCFRRGTARDAAPDAGNHTSSQLQYWSDVIDQHANASKANLALVLSVL